MSGEIRVNPPSVQNFGRQAQELFGQIRIELEGLVNDAVAVPYYGPNAESFKTECGQLGTSFAHALTADLRSIADIVQTVTTNIAHSLGGAPIVIEFNGGQISPPAVPTGDGSLGINTAALESFKNAGEARLRRVSELLNTNLANLRSTDWTGNAKEQAVGGVGDYTGKANSKVEETRTALVNAVDEQIKVARLADQQS